MFFPFNGMDGHLDSVSSRIFSFLFSSVNFLSRGPGIKYFLKLGVVIKTPTGLLLGEGAGVTADLNSEGLLKWPKSSKNHTQKTPKQRPKRPKRGVGGVYSCIITLNMRCGNDDATSCIGGTVGDPLEGVKETSKHDAGRLCMVIIII